MNLGYLARTAILAAALSFVTAAQAQESFPDKPIQLVTPYPPGGSHSLHAGIIATVAEPHFGQPMISVIRAGGGGVVGANEVLQKDADGYTLLFGDPNLNSLRPQIEDLPFETDDFVAVARINYAPWIFVASKDAPFDDMKSMVEWARSNEGDFVYSSDNVNGPTYLVFEMLKAQTGVPMRGVAFGGGGPAVAQVIGGNTMAYAGDPGVVGDHVTSGQLKGLCVTDSTRWEPLPDIPTCAEAGFDMRFHFWRGVLAPKGTPEERIAALSDGFAKLVEDEGFLRLINTINSSVAFLGHDEFAKYLAEEQTQLKELYEKIQTAN